MVSEMYSIDTGIYELDTVREWREVSASEMFPITNVLPEMEDMEEGIALMVEELYQLVASKSRINFLLYPADVLMNIQYQNPLLTSYRTLQGWLITNLMERYDEEDYVNEQLYRWLCYVQPTSQVLDLLCCMASEAFVLTFPHLPHNRISCLTIDFELGDMEVDFRPRRGLTYVR